MQTKYEGGFPVCGGAVVVNSQPDADGRYGFQFFYPGASNHAYAGTSATEKDAIPDCLALVGGRGPETDPVVMAAIYG